MASIFTFVYNAISQGYVFLESIYSLLPLAQEIIIIDCGSTDGTFELIQSFNNPNIRIYQDHWINGLGGRNYRRTSIKCHELCDNDIIVFAEADEIWHESLVAVTKKELQYNNNLKFWRYQLTQNFQRAFWYPEKEQHVHRVFPKNSTIMQGGDIDIFIQDSIDAQVSKLISNDYGYIIDCRNIFRDTYLFRENFAKTIWAEENRTTTRMAPAHAGYSWEINDAQLQEELKDERWIWKHTIFNLPEILKYHLGKTKYEIRPDLIKAISEWYP